MEIYQRCKHKVYASSRSVDSAEVYFNVESRRVGFLFQPIKNPQPDWIKPIITDDDISSSRAEEIVARQEERQLSLSTKSSRALGTGFEPGTANWN